MKSLAEVATDVVTTPCSNHDYTVCHFTPGYNVRRLPAGNKFQSGLFSNINFNLPENKKNCSC